MPNNPNAAANLKPFTGADDPRRGVKPKGTKHISTWIQNMMEDEKFETILLDPKKGAVEYKGAPLKAIISVATKHAIAGDQRWADWLAKYGYGTKSEVDITSNGETVGKPDPELAADFAKYLKQKTKA